jgi:hypothetical protein
MHGLPLCLLTDVVCCGGGMKQLYITTLKREYMKTNTRKLYLLESVWMTGLEWFSILEMLTY